MFNIKTIIGILADFSLFFLMMTNLLNLGVWSLLAACVCEDRKTGTVLLQMCALMTNMGLIITVNIFILVTLYFIFFIFLFIFFGLAKSSDICIAGLGTLRLQSLSKEMCLWKLQKKSVHSKSFIPNAGDSRNSAIKPKLKTSKDQCSLVLISVIKKCSITVNKQISLGVQRTVNVSLSCIDGMWLCGGVCQHAAHGSMLSRWQLENPPLVSRMYSTPNWWLEQHFPTFSRMGGALGAASFWPSNSREGAVKLNPSEGQWETNNELLFE